MTGPGKQLLALSVVLGLVLGTVVPAAPAAPAPVTADEALAIATDAYLYAFPLVLMEITRRVMTNTQVADGARQRAPVNQFAHVPAFPDASFTDVVRPNADTLYSVLWFDLSREPLVIDVPDSGGRYYLLPMLDLWTDVFASPGKRTTGTGTQTWVLTGPRWKGGRLPRGVTQIKSPTAVGWLIGRTQTNGKADYEAVHRFQAGLKAVQLSAWGRTGFTPLPAKKNPQPDESAPVEQVEKMTAARFFALFAELTRETPPHSNDYPILQRMARIGLVPGRRFDIARVSPEAKAALEAAPKAASQKILAAVQRLGTPVNGWRNILAPIGTYGTDYLRRATIAYFGLGANVIEDAIYPTALTDADGRPFDSAARYNWLPAPKSGGFSMNLRLYWPKPAALDGAWAPPPVRRVF